MKTFTAILEDLWVAVVFAEAGVDYEPSVVQDLQTGCQDIVSIHAV